MITYQILKFSLFTIILTILFKYCLSLFISYEDTSLIVTTSLLYFFAMLLNGYYFGKKEYKTLAIYDIGFRFHLITYLIHNSIAFLWIVVGFNSEQETFNPILKTTLFWLFGVGIHFCIYLYTKKTTIKGLHKDDLFE